MKDKSKLYKLSRPHNVQTAFDHKMEFRALVGTYEKNRMITIEAYNLSIAMADANNLCRGNETVLEITKDGKILWEHKI